MKHEFKVTKSKEQTVYTLESATGGSSSTSDIASMDSTLGGMQRRNPPGDNILAQEKKETPKPRNFVAKNAKMGGAGQHKDKKKAMKQGDVKHKKPLAESSYAEDLAKQVFNANPNIKDENAVLDAAWPIAVKDLGNKRAMSVFNYDEDFPSDLVSVYGWLQKDQQGVAEDDHEEMYSPEAIKIGNHFIKEFNLTDDMDQQLAIEIVDNCLEGGLTDPMQIKKQVIKYLRQSGTNIQSRKQGVAEDDQGNVSDTELDTIDPQDHDSMEGSFVKNQIHTMLRVLKHLEHAIGDEEDLPEWVQMKLSQAQESVVGIMNFMISDKEREVERQTGNDSLMKEELQARLAELKAKVEGVYRNNYHANTTGFSRGPRDPEGEDDPREFRKYNLTIDGKPLNPQPITGRSNLIKWGRGQAAAGVDLSNAMISLVDEDAYMESLTNMLERSVSQAQHNLMVGVANNPQFAQKVKVKQNVGQEFANADQGHDISKLPIRVPKKK